MGLKVWPRVLRRNSTGKDPEQVKKRKVCEQQWLVLSVTGQTLPLSEAGPVGKAVVPAHPGATTNSHSTNNTIPHTGDTVKQKPKGKGKSYS